VSTMEDWVKMYGATIQQTFPHHLVVVWYPRGEWAMNADNLRVDHMMCLMEWLNERLVEQRLTVGQRYRIYRSWGRSWLDAWRLALVRP
jgi:hypothetical protein